jgi:hypothetical protein
MVNKKKSFCDIIKYANSHNKNKLINYAMCILFYFTTSQVKYAGNFLMRLGKFCQGGEQMEVFSNVQYWVYVI